MAKLPEPRNATVDAIYRWRERNTDTGHRAHLGASVIGHPCDRHLWMLWHWCESEQFDGRMLRLFETGKREEPRVIEELRGIGCQVWADDGAGQYRVSAVAGHFGGSMDGVAQGIPEAPKTPHVLEIKTHSAKSFADLLKNGVRVAKPMHFAQMQTYMRLAELDRALYFAVNKDTDAVYLERVEHDKAESQRLLDRAARIVNATEPPLRISEDPAWFECKFCRFHEHCHGTAAPEVNCRTCAHSTASLDGDAGAWRCEIDNNAHSEIPVSVQRTGCGRHRFIPILLERFAKPIDMEGDGVRYAMTDGREFVNGEKPGLSSHEIRAAADKRFLVDGAVQQLREQFPSARVAA